MNGLKKRVARLLAAMAVCLVLCGGALPASLLVREASGEVPGETSGEISGGASGEISGEASGEISGEASDEISGKTSGEISGESSVEISEETSGEASGESSSDGQEPLWREDYYRAVDASGASEDGLTEAEQKSLDEDCVAFIEKFRLDLSMIALSSGSYEGGTIEAYADGYYTDGGFGYGADGDGFQMVWDTQTDKVVIRAYGEAVDRVPASYLRFVEGSVAKYREKYGIYGPMYAAMRFLSNYLEEHDGEKAKKVPEAARGAAGSGGKIADSADADQNEAGGAEGASRAGTLAAAAVTADGGGAGDDLKNRVLPDGESPDPSLRVGEGAQKPSWYPRDPSTFPFYHDETAPRVVDRADIFSEEEERQMRERISVIRDSLQRDVVVFTDVSAYGASHRDYADDFFDFNGYGYGEDFEGVCLMICMDPDDRGWWCSCSGPVTMGLYTETVANQIDDLLYEYMVSGDYGEGVLDWIENFRRLYTTGSPYSEAWALAGAGGIEALRAAAPRDADAHRVVDDARLLSEEEAASLEEKVKELSEKYGVDLAVHTAYDPGILDKEEYGELYFAYQGYGLGEDHDGICLTIFKRPGYSGSCSVYACGKAREKLTNVNRGRLEDRCRDVILHRKFYQAADSWLSQTELMLRTGRAPRSRGSWIFWTLLECLAGLIAGSIGLGRARRKMATPSAKENANAYIVPGSVSVVDLSDQLINTVVNRVYSPIKRESSGGSSSSRGRSSYSSHHTGSSGRTHSGSGRRF